MTERRVKTERRKEDIGPPKGCFERRKRPDRRLPVAEETQLSADEFARLFGGMPGTGALASERAAAILDRAFER